MLLVTQNIATSNTALSQHALPCREAHLISLFPNVFQTSPFWNSSRLLPAKLQAPSQPSTRPFGSSHRRRHGLGLPPHGSYLPQLRVGAVPTARRTVCSNVNLVLVRYAHIYLCFASSTRLRRLWTVCSRGQRCASCQRLFCRRGRLGLTKVQDYALVSSVAVGIPSAVLCAAWVGTASHLRLASTLPGVEEPPGGGGARRGPGREGSGPEPL